jgi:hypothetical protein
LVSLEGSLLHGPDVNGGDGGVEGDAAELLSTGPLVTRLQALSATMMCAGA